MIKTATAKILPVQWVHILPVTNFIFGVQCTFINTTEYSYPHFEIYAYFVKFDNYFFPGALYLLCSAHSSKLTAPSVRILPVQY